MLETLTAEKKSPESPLLEVISLSVSSKVLRAKSLQEVQILFAFKLS